MGKVPAATRRTLVVGVAVAASYAAVYVATVRLSARHQRPLFDGVAPSAPYRWVNPPSEFEQGNVPPHPSTIDLPLAPDGFKATGATSEDGQVVLNLPDGAVPARPGETGVRVVVTPLDPAKLGRLPPGLFADGNAYRIEMRYVPSGVAIGSLAKPGNLVMTVPAPSVALVESPDGRTWQRLDIASAGPSTNPAVQFARAGDYLGASDVSPLSGGGSSSDNTGRIVLVAGIAAVLAMALVLTPVLVRRARRTRRNRTAIERQRSQGSRKRRPSRRRPRTRKRR
jgi:hypothetical protein